MMFRTPAERISGDLINPNLPVLLADFRLSGIGQVVVMPHMVHMPQVAATQPWVQPVPTPAMPAQPRPIRSTPAVPVSAPIPMPTPRALTPQPVPQPQAASSAVNDHEKVTRAMIGTSLTEYVPPIPASENQLLSIVAAHANKQASGEAYDVQINAAFVKQERPNDAPVGKANLRRHLEAKERLAKEGIDPRRLGKRPEVSYLGSAAITSSASKQAAHNTPEPPSVQPPAVLIDADPELLEMMDGETAEMPMLAERPESDEVVEAGLSLVSAEQETDSTIDLVLPRRARPT
ncbi:MAG: hypothetical protein ACPG8W_13775 [Candidatus Promineifilaceae bacterium]